MSSAKINSAKSSRFCQSQKLIPQKCIIFDLQIAKINSAKNNSAKINYFRVYTYREQFEKAVVPYVQKPLLPDALKLKYLGDPALTLVKELITIKEIWERSRKSYCNTWVLLQNKLGDLVKMSGLEKIRGEDNLVY